jgi:hypothetical protein
MPLRAFQLFVFLFLVCSCTWGQNALKLLNDCKGVPEGGRATIDDVVCLTYLDGFVSGLRMAQLSYTGSANGQPSMARVSLVCLPTEGIAPEQTRRIVVKYVNDHPESLHEHRDIIVLVALMNAFPACIQPPESK